MDEDSPRVCPDSVTNGFAMITLLECKDGFLSHFYPVLKKYVHNEGEKNAFIRPARCARGLGCDDMNLMEFAIEDLITQKRICYHKDLIIHICWYQNQE